MLEAQVRIMQEKLSKVRNIDTIQFSKTIYLAAIYTVKFYAMESLKCKKYVFQSLLIPCLSLLPDRVPVLSGNWTAWPVSNRGRRRNGGQDKNYSSNNLVTSSRSASKCILYPVSTYSVPDV